MKETKRIEIGRITVTREGVEIDSSVVLCLTESEEELVGKSLEELGFRKLNKEQFIKVLAEDT